MGAKPIFIGADPATQVRVDNNIQRIMGVDSDGNPIPSLPMQGVDADGAVVTAKPVQIAGVAVNPSTYSPTYIAGRLAKLAIDLVSGGLLVVDRIKTRAIDSISADPKQGTVASTATPITADGTVFTLAAGEKGYIQNCDDAALYVKYGTGASSASFHFIIPAGVASNDGTSPAYDISDWIGPVSVAAATGSPRVSAFKVS